MARRTTWTGYVSTGVSALLAVWILALLIQPTPPQPKPGKTQAKPEDVAKAEPAPEPIPAALALPAPPKPTPPKPAPTKGVKPKPQPEPVTETVQEAPPKPVHKAKVVQKSKPKPKPKPKPKTPAPFVPAAADVVEGRTLLRTLEHGKGPLIEIAWPSDRSKHGRLFKHMTACLGMRVAVMDNSSHLFVAEGKTGQPWDINLDRYSGFLRQPAGWLTPLERNAETAIRKHHNMKSVASGVRIFPRQVDAALLGGLRKYIGTHYSTAKSIRARYRLNGTVVVVENLSVDGKAVAGRIGLKAQTSRCVWRT
ncbi:hypothetical protein V5T82_14670 [Magnetovibrio sp. PR-2]|uniref:hypothetical protein n=1 Tax=Magnetovibrio sp. PR-2 TaxID=3120356 RepID=UPI002FCDE697